MAELGIPNHMAVLALTQPFGVPGGHYYHTDVFRDYHICAEEWAPRVYAHEMGTGR